MTEIANAMVLAAGFGTRMRPFTDEVPKPLVSLAGRALLDRVLDRLAEAHVRRAVVNVHYLADKIEAHLAQRRTPEIVISDERDAILETGGGVKKALPLLGDGPFLVHNSDTVWSEGVGSASNLQMLMNAWEPGKMAALLLLAHRDSSIGYEGRGDFLVDASGRLQWRGAAPNVPHIYAGVSILTPQLFEGVNEKAFSLVAILNRAMAQGALYGVTLDGVWMHVGTPEALIEAENHLHELERRRA